MNLSIIIPTYNRPGWLSECLQALEHNEAEIIVVDDGSPEPVEVPTKVRLIRHDRNRGRAAAVNTGLRAASHDLVLMLDDDIYAAPDMVVRMTDEFAIWNNPKLALVGRVVWDPEVKLTLTMRWLEEAGPFHDIAANRSGTLSNLATGNTMMWRPFILEAGGFDEGFTHYGLEDVELGLRLKQRGLEIRLLSSAVGYHHKSMKVRDLVHRELQEGLSAVYLHSRFPDYLPQVEDTENLLRNAERAREASAAVEEIALLEQSDSSRMPQGVAELFMLVYRYHFLKGILNGLKNTGGFRPSRQSAATIALYTQASRLESMGDLGEARRLFQLVRDRQDRDLWAGAEYHLGNIERSSGNEDAAREHYNNCLLLNPGHSRAAECLKIPSLFREIRSNVYERIDAMRSKVLFVLFGGLEDVVQAFPVVGALRDRYHSSEIVWLTSPQHAALARASYADKVESSPNAVIPWDLVRDQHFTHVFCPGTAFNLDAWKDSGLPAMAFMARQCGVELESRKAWLEPGPEALFEAEQFLNDNGLARKAFVTAAVPDSSGRHWFQANLQRLQKAVELPVVVLGGSEAGNIPGTIPCPDASFRMAAALIRWSTFFVGPDSGLSWLATTTNTPMGIVARSAGDSSLFRDTLRADKDDIMEWGAGVAAETVAEHIVRSHSPVVAS